MSDSPKVKKVTVIIEFEGQEPTKVSMEADDLHVQMIQRREVAAIYPDHSLEPKGFINTGYSGIGLMVTKDDPVEHEKFLALPGDSVVSQGDRLAWPRDWS